MELKEAIASWKKLNLNRVVLTFNCGGDNMGDMDWELYDNENNLVNDADLISYFDTEVFNHVDFYVNSDGHYIGEAGTVTVELEDDGDFCYNKDAYSDFSESVNSDILIELTDAEVAFIKEYVRDINGDDDNVNVNFNYSKDFIMNDEMTELEDSISEKINDFTSNFVPKDIEEDGECEEWYTFETETNPIEFDGSSIKIAINNSYTIQRYSEC